MLKKVTQRLKTKHKNEWIKVTEKKWRKPIELKPYLSKNDDDAEIFKYTISFSLISVFIYIFALLHFDS